MNQTFKDLAQGAEKLNSATVLRKQRRLARLRKSQDVPVFPGLRKITQEKSAVVKMAEMANHIKGHPPKHGVRNPIRAWRLPRRSSTKQARDLRRGKRRNRRVIHWRWSHIEHPPNVTDPRECIIILDGRDKGVLESRSQRIRLARGVKHQSPRAMERMRRSTTRATKTLQEGPQATMRKSIANSSQVKYMTATKRCPACCEWILLGSLTAKFFYQ